MLHPPTFFTVTLILQSAYPQDRLGPLHHLPGRNAFSLGTKETEAGKMGEEGPARAGEEEGEMQRGLDYLKTDYLSVANKCSVI